MKALYRKYRPTKLSEVIGQEQVVKNLEASLKKGHISHAYLFTGPRGCGKTSVARIFAHEINGFKYELEDFYPDILEIDAASNTGVDNIRELRERAAVAPAEGKYKVYIIDEVHMLSKSAFNALLKTLEEPPKHVIFIMATTDAYKVPTTIVSRSQVYEFKLAAPDVMQQHLKEIAKKEGIKIKDDAMELIVHRGGGSFRDSISLLDQISTIKDGEITADDIVKSLGLPEQTKIENLLEAYLSGKLAEISACLKDLLNSGVRAEVIAEEIIGHIVENPRAELLPLLKSLADINSPFPEAKLLLAFTDRQEYQNSKEVAPIKNTGARRPSAMSNKDEGPIERHSSGEQKVSNVEDQPSLETFLEAVRSASPSISDILKNTTQRLEGDTICIIPEKAIYKTILSSKNNLELLKKQLPKNYNLKILDPEDSVISTNDPQISKISAIMGGKVMEVKSENGGNIPF